MTTKEVLLKKVSAIGGAIQELGEVPNGHLYAHVMGHVDFEEYTSIINLLKRAGLVKEDNYLLTWIGPVKKRDCE